MAAIDRSKTVGVIGAGTMGSGIAQLAAAAGHHVLLYDAFEGAAEAGRTRMADGLEKIVARGKMARKDMEALLSRVETASETGQLSGAALVVEAIVEDLDVKRRLFATLEDVVSPQAILATNTSSISVTSIGRDLKRPDRLVGMHFFNPATIMKLVEVISGVATSTETAQTIFATAEAWGKVAVHAKSTPGFIVNRVARSYYAEALRLYEEQVADPATLDALMTEGGGFRMGPFELMDLIGHDVNYAVSLSVFNAYYQEPRFRPSNLQLELVNAGRLGRKTGHGFYSYHQSAQKPVPATEPVQDGAAIFEYFTLGKQTQADGVWLMPTDGRTAHSLAAGLGQPVVVYDLTASPGTSSRLGFATSSNVSPATVRRFVATLAAQNVKATHLPDWPGLVVMRTVATLANEAFEAVLQAVAGEADVDAAMRYGVNYPQGPIEWARAIGLSRISAVLDSIHDLTGDPRYRASLGLRMAARN